VVSAAQALEPFQRDVEVFFDERDSRVRAAPRS